MNAANVQKKNIDARKKQKSRKLVSKGICWQKNLKKKRNIFQDNINLDWGGFADKKAH